MSGGGIPFAGTLKNLISVTHNDETNRDSLMENLCLVNSYKKPVNGDVELHNLINQVCNLNNNIKEGNKGNGIIKGAMRLIGNVATLPLRTASSAVKSITGVNPGEVVSNMIVNSNKPPEVNQSYKLLQSPTKSKIEQLKDIDYKIKSGGSLTQEEFKLVNDL